MQQKLKNKINKLKEYFSQYESSKLIDEFKEIHQKVEKQEYKIAIVASTRAGKSTLINTLLGKDILPTSHHAITYIYSQPNIDKKAKIFFSDEQDTREITENIELYIKQFAQNEEENKDKNIEKIELYYPCKTLQANLVLIDVPSSNSTNDQIKNILNDVDMALFTFDYTQLDTSDDQELWDTIKARYTKDPTFKICFLINKIDLAIEAEADDDNSKEWCTHKQKAIEDLKQTAKKYGIEDPQIYAVASEWALLKRNASTSPEWKKIRDCFEIKYLDEGEEELLKYMGIESLENKIKESIEGKEEILKTTIPDAISKIIKDEKINLENEIQRIQESGKKARIKVNDALFFLNEESKNIQNETLRKFDRETVQCKEEIDKSINSAIENEISSKIEDILTMGIVYAQEIASGSSSQLADKKANYILKDTSIIPFDRNLEIDLPIISLDKKAIWRTSQNYIEDLLHVYKNNYLNVVSANLEKTYIKYENEIKNIFREVPTALNSRLQDVLTMDAQSTKILNMNIHSSSYLDISIPYSAFDYGYSAANYVRMTRQQDEFTKLIIKPNVLKESIIESITVYVEEFLEREKSNFSEQVRILAEKYFVIFEDFKGTKKEEIEELQVERKNFQQELANLEKQYELFSNCTKE